MNPDEITVSTAFSLYTDHCKSSGRKDSSLKLNGYARGYFEDYISEKLDSRNVTLSVLDRFFVRGFLIWLREQRRLSASTVQRIYDVLSAVFRFLVHEELVEQNPMDKVAKPRRSPNPINPLSPEQVQLLVNACDGDTFTSIRNRLIIALLFDTGVRATELCMVDLDDVDQTQRRILLRHTKSGEPRFTYYSRVVSILLSAYLQAEWPHHSKRLMITRTGGAVDRHWLYRTLRRLGEKAGVPVHPHLLRHSCAVASIRNGSDVSMVMKLLGHTNPRMSLHYSQLADSHVQEIHSRTSPADRLVVHKEQPQPPQKREG